MRLLEDTQAIGSDHNHLPYPNYSYTNPELDHNRGARRRFGIGLPYGSRGCERTLKRVGDFTIPSPRNTNYRLED